MAKIPKSLQPILWSRDIKNLDIKRDSAYIVNQVLAYGKIEHLKWLFQNYGGSKIKETFLKKPIKTYSPEAFNLVKTILLNEEKELTLGDERYVENLPRNIRSSKA